MTNPSFFGCVALTLSLAMSAAATPPPVSPKPVREPAGPVDPSLKEVRKFVWHLDRNFVHDIQVVRAVDITPFTPEELRSRYPERPDAPKFAVWSKAVYDTELKRNNGTYVVDEKVFTDLQRVYGHITDKLPAQGRVIGQVKLEKYDPEKVVEFLVYAGILDANIHVVATVTGTHFKSDSGDWFALHSDDPYWTSRDNLATYDFGVHVANDGTIRFHHQADIGRMLAKAAEEKTGEK